MAGHLQGQWLLEVAALVDEDEALWLDHEVPRPILTARHVHALRDEDAMRGGSLVCHEYEEPDGPGLYRRDVALLPAAVLVVVTAGP